MYGDRVPEGEYLVPIGVAEINEKETMHYIVSFGKITEVYKAAEELEKEEVSLGNDRIQEPYAHMIRRRFLNLKRNQTCYFVCFWSGHLVMYLLRFHMVQVSVYLDAPIYRM
jgi:hypothetical protein